MLQTEALSAQQQMSNSDRIPAASFLPPLTPTLIPTSYVSSLVRCKVSIRGVKLPAPDISHIHGSHLIGIWEPNVTAGAMHKD